MLPSFLNNRAELIKRNQEDYLVEEPTTKCEGLFNGEPQSLIIFTTFLDHLLIWHIRLSLCVRFSPGTYI